MGILICLLIETYVKRLRKLKKILGIYDVRLAFEFSLMKNGDFIPPHNDTESKIISLMIYLQKNKKTKN